jgi:hypothetical protein
MWEAFRCKKKWLNRDAGAGSRELKLKLGKRVLFTTLHDYEFQNLQG